MNKNLWESSTVLQIYIFLLIAVHTHNTNGDTRRAGHCRSTNSHPYSWLATKTPYTYLVGNRSLPNPVRVENCSAVQLWSLVRHGTRYPSKEAIRLMKTDLKLLRDRIVTEGNGGELCGQDFQSLIDWEIDINITQAKELHAEGEMEMRLIGERFASRFPDLLDNYEPNKFQFRSTNTQRSQLSGRNYAIGLFGKLIGNKVAFEDPILPHDPVIRSYKLCHKWKTEVKRNPRSMQERHKFEKSEVMNSVVVNVTQLLGLSEQLTMGDLDMMYVMCNFDQAWQPHKLSPWCSVFSTEQLQLMEYREDLEYYWVDGPAYPVTANQSCPLLRDLYNNFNRVIDREEGSHKGVFYFSHSGSVLKLLALLGIYEDHGPLLSDNYEAMISQRKWQTSFIGPFAANVAVALTQCGDNRSDYSVGIYINEKLTPLPNCGGDLWCPWETFINLYPGLKECDFDIICDNGNVGSDSVEVADDKY